MKTKILLTTLLSFIFYLLSSQVPQGFNYQAIARDADGNLINDPFYIKVEIQNLAADTIFWIEEHNVTPNEYGLISFVVGQTGRIGGTATNFSDIDWTSRPRYLKTSANLGTGYTVMGTTQIMAVPYSLVAKDVTGPIERLGIKGTTEEMDEALFEVKNKDGQTIFAVYNQGVRIYVDDSGKGVKGGFAIGGFGTVKGTSQPYFIVKPDTVRIYINQSGKGVKGGFAIGGYGIDKADPQNFLFVSDDSVRIYIDNADTDLKGVKGGFAIGGYGVAKGKPQDLFTVSNDSVRIYLDKAPTDKGVKGGFAIGGYGTTKAPEEEYLRVTRDSTRVYVKEDSKAISGGFAIGGIGGVSGTITPFTSLTPNNYFIGHNSGKNITTGLYNSFLGYEAGRSNSEGDRGIFLGYRAGYKNTVGDYNTFIGSYAGHDNLNGYRNVFIGDSAGASNTKGNLNVFVGYQAGKSNTEGNTNTFIGELTGAQNTTGYYNTFIGTNAGYSNIKGRLNVFIGTLAGRDNTVGERNIFIGQASGVISDSSNYNVFIGDRSGMGNTRGSNNVMIGSWAGQITTTGNNNVFLGDHSGFINQNGNFNTYIGYRAGEWTTGDNNVFLGAYAGKLEEGSNKLYIANSISTDPLIYGIFDADPANQILTIYGKMGIGTISPLEALDVIGNARFSNIGSGAYVGPVNRTIDGTLTIATSDIRFKENVNTLDNCLSSVLRLRGVAFTWKNEPDMGKRVGFIAQEVEQVIPELVFTNPVDGYKGVNYAEMTAVLVEAIKEQQQQIESYKSQLQLLQEKVDKIEEILAKSLDE